MRDILRRTAGAGPHFFRLISDNLRSTTNFYACDEAKKIELIDFFKGRLLYSLTNLEQEISQINSQKYILTIHDVLNDDMKKILGDLHFEFQY